MRQIISSTELHSKEQYPTTTACELDPSGCMVTIGDAAGRLKIYEKIEGWQIPQRHAFTAHHAGNDWRSSEEVSSTVRAIVSLSGCASSQRLLTTNGREVCLWKASRQQLVSTEKSIDFLPKRIRSVGHHSQHQKIMEILNCHIGGISAMDLCSNDQRLLTTNGYEVAIRQLDRPDTSLQVASVPRHQQVSLDDRVGYRSIFDGSTIELECEEQERSSWKAIPSLSSVHFHGARDNCLGWAGKFATIDYLDLRFSSTTYDRVDRLKPSVSMSTPLHQDYLKRTMQQVSDFGFLQDGVSVASRDFLYAYMWDIRNPGKPTTRQTIYPPIFNFISSLYEEEELNHAFRMRLTPDGRMVTGGYGPYFQEIDLKKGENHRYNILDGSCEKVSKSLVAGEFDATTSTSLVACGEQSIAAVYGNRLSLFT